MKKQTKCYIYTRVSTAIQVDGYSLDAQRDKLSKYAEYQDMEVVKEFSDAGHSGKNINGRPEFSRMLEEIASGADGISYVLVFKLSRFGRNAADVLSSLQLMQDYGVNLICVEDGIDSSKEARKLMISVLSAVAEIERENILVQTMEGRRQKAREGRWNGGFAPYGYTLVNGELIIAEDEAEIIRIIFDKYMKTKELNIMDNYGEIIIYQTEDGLTKHHINVKVDMDELDLTSVEAKATYKEIEELVQEHYGFQVTNLNIAQVKQKHGIIERVNYNKPKSENSRQLGTTPEKENAITEALKFFKMI